MVGAAIAAEPVDAVGDRWLLRALTVLAVIAPYDLVVGSSDTTDRLMLRPGPLLAVVVAVLGAAHIVADRQRSRRRPALVAIVVAWTGFVWLSALLSDDRLTGAGGALRVTIVAVLALVTASVIGDAAEPLTVARRLMSAIVVGTTVAAVVGLVVLVNDGDLLGTSALHGSITDVAGRARLTRPWTHANVAAMALGSALPLSVAVARVHRFAWICSPLVAGAAAATLSRGFAIAVVAMAVVALTMRLQRREVMAVGAAVATAAALLALTPGWSTRAGDGVDVDRGAVVLPPDDTLVDLGDSPGGAGTAIVTVRNEGSETWDATGPERVEISARWVSLSAAPGIHAEERWPLPADVAPGTDLELVLEIGADPDSGIRRLPNGEYRVLWDLLIDEEAYFLQFAGRSAPSRGVITGSQSNRMPVVGELVEPRRNIGRSTIWRLAVDRFSERPLVGVGPNQLGAASLDDLDGDERFPGQHAHNIVLEPLATWGVVGTVPFVLLLGGAMIGSWRSARRATDEATRSIDGAVALSLIAVVGHGLVDWHLGFTSLGIPLAIVIGIAWPERAGPERAGPERG